MSANNKVIAGDYEGLVIIDNTILSVILATKRQAAGIDIPADENDIEIPLDPKHIQSYKVVPSKGDDSQLVDVVFRDGKRSLIQLDSIAYEAFIKKNFNLDSYKQPEKKPIILGEIAEGKEQNSSSSNNSNFVDNKQFIEIRKTTTIGNAKISSNSDDADPFYKKGWFILLALLFIYPIGLILLWKSRRFALAGKVLCSVFLFVLWLPLFMIAVIDKPTKVQTQTQNDITTTQEQQEQKQEEKKIDLASKIADGAIVSYTQKAFPKTYKKWGKQNVETMNKLMPEFALLVASSDKCDIVTEVNLSDNRSTPKKEMVFWAGCKNGERFYMTDNDIKSKEKPISDSEYLAEGRFSGRFETVCAEIAKQSLTHPSTFDYSSFGVDYHMSQAGTVEVILPFEAKNSFNLTIGMEARCYFDSTRGVFDFSIKERR